MQAYLGPARYDMSILSSIFGTHSDREIKKILPIVEQIESLSERFAGMTDEQLQAMTPAFRERIAKGETLDALLPEAFAVVREAATRVLGKRHYRVQLIGGIVIHEGRIAEMKTGEGKTLVATLPAYLNALNGKGVHIVTVNDYLARRDSEWMGKVYNFLGLTVGLIVNGLTPPQRKEAYAADITYGTNNEFGFDYLRDNMVVRRENMVQRGHAFAIVDEVDSILIDEARTPLIISGQSDKSTELYEKADKFVAGLTMHKLKELDDKESHEDIEGDYIVDEKARTAVLTAEGIKKAEAHFHVDNLSDPDNATLSHHLNQAIRARGIMQRDVDYVVKDGEVLIVDSFTGRIMVGRRYSNGLHQAIEAKEGVKVANEMRTHATITFQNFFRLYGKLSGMTGTALTEEEEFREIYKLDVIEIPTNRPMIRKDQQDVVYKSVKGKLHAVVDQIIQCHEKGQPVLVGTVSIEKSEMLSDILKKNGIKHNVLNAKFHEKEAEIIAQAGKFGAVTISTNMAGRGTDIMLGGNAEFMAKNEMRKRGLTPEQINQATSYYATDDEQILSLRAMYQELNDKFEQEIAPEREKVIAAGGLFILGTERHESRRIDNQLRGRAGRQGDPGASRFFLSLEDDLMRLFGSDKLIGMVERLGLDDDTPIDAKILSNSIESAQKKLEEQNFSRRKNVLTYDDVMNQQRALIYGQRQEVLSGADIKDKVLSMIDEVIGSAVENFVAGDVPEDWNLDALRGYFYGILTTDEDYHYHGDEYNQVSRESILQDLLDRAHKKYEEKEALFPEGRLREVERMVLLRNVDQKWMDHIDAMDDLIEGINLRAYGQQNPITAYRLESGNMFDEMIASVKEDTAKMLLSVQPANEIRREEVSKNNTASIKRDPMARPRSSAAGVHGAAAEPPKKKEPIRKSAAEKVGRNDPCPCGSGKKYKKCCGANVDGADSDD